MTALVLYSAELDALATLEWVDGEWIMTIIPEHTPHWEQVKYAPMKFDWTLIGVLK